MNAPLIDGLKSRSRPRLRASTVLAEFSRALARQAPCEGGSDRPMPEAMLWVAVIHRRACDAIGLMGGVNAANEGEAGLARRRAEDWWGSRDFAAVCDLLGFHPDWVLALYRRALAGIDRLGGLDKRARAFAAGLGRRGAA